jgi:16S rRNA (uracil1498-N3)-methyltransferase
MLPRFYLKKNLINIENMVLPKDIVTHIYVKRLREKDSIEIIDGEGGVYIFLINAINKKQITLNFLKNYTESSTNRVKLNLAMAIIQNDKFDLVLQKSVELGVDKIIPIITQRTQGIKLDRLENKIEHWQKIIQNSACQCGQNILPVLSPVMLMNDFIINLNQNSKKYIFSVVNNLLKNNQESNLDIKEINMLVGPEGGFTNDEENLAIANGFVPIHLGNLVLRSETSAIAGISIMNTFFRNFIQGL